MHEHARAARSGDACPVVLVVDDDRAVRRLFVTALERGGYQVLEVSSGQAALELLARREVDVVLLDRSMPDMPGEVLLRQLRSDPRTERLRVLMVTGDGQLGSKIAGLGAGANDYLVKPIALGELLARVAAQLDDRTRWHDHLEGKLATRARLSRELATLPADLPLSGLETALRRILACEFDLQQLALNPLSAGAHSPIDGHSISVGETAEGAASIHASVPLRPDHQTVAILEVEAASDRDDLVPTLLDLAPQIASLLTSAIPADGVNLDTRRWVDAVLVADSLRCVYQPIVSLADRVTVGFEGLSRFADGTAPDVAFRAASRAGVGAQLEVQALQRLVAGATSIPEGCWLSVNLSAATLLAVDLADVLAPVSRPIVLEITEHEHVEDYPALRARSAQLANVRLAVDDTGAGYASLRHIYELQPELVKLDRSWVADIHTDPTRQALVRSVVAFTDAIDATLVGEGIEHEDEARTLAELGVELGQGYLLGRPAPR